jgi:8-oxo-dGTP diphosphatase
VPESLVAMPQADGGKPKLVEFWRMRAGGKPVRKLMRDVKAVKWLPLDKAIATLTHRHEQAFLGRVGPDALNAAKRSAHSTAAPASQETFAGKIRAWLRRMIRQT